MSRLLSILIATIALRSGANVVDVRLAIDPVRTLRGIPVSFTIRVENLGPNPLRVPAAAILVAQEQRGQEFAVFCDAGSVELPLEAVTLPPGTSHVYDIATDGTLLQPRWIDDGRLFYRLGTYRLEVRLVDHVRERTVGPKEVPSTAWKSNSVTLTVDEPRGDDLNVWAALEMFCKGSWHPMKALTPEGAALAHALVVQYPDSTYAGWLASFGLGITIERVEHLRDWLRNHDSDDVLGDRRKLLLATWDSQLSEIYSITEPEKSRHYRAQAAFALQTLSKHAHNETIRATAMKRLKELSDE